MYTSHTMYPKIAINIVTWNSMDFLPDLLRSIQAQTWTDFSVLIIDNASTDQVEEFVRREYPNVTFLRNVKNRGFAYAHNQGIRYALEHWPADDLGNRFVLVTNPDILLAPDYLERIMGRVSEEEMVGSYGGKLLRAFGENLGDEILKETVCSDHLDSTGLQANRSRDFTDRGAGEMDTKQYDHLRKVFGISGALALYRASALRDIAYQDEFFDNDFFAYKEDVDLAWRLQIAGWQARYVPEARAHHYRGMFGHEKSGIFEKMANRRKKSPIRNYLSTRNHAALLIKNQDAVGAFLALPWLAAKETGRLFYVLIFEPKSLRGYWEVLKNFSRFYRKRLASFKKRRIGWRELRKWFV